MRKVYFIIFIILTTSIFATPNDDLLDAAAKSDLPKIESALATGADIDYADSENRTALYFAYDITLPISFCSK